MSTISDAGVTPEPEATVSRRPAGAMMRTALRLWRTRIGVALVVLLVLVAIVGPAIAPHGPSEYFGVPPNSPPSSKAYFGTDYIGQDVWSRFLYGGREILVMAVLATALGLVLGTAVGLTAAYARNSADDVLMRGMDVILAFPQIVLILLFVSILGSKLWLIVLMVALAWVPQVARVIRGVTADVAHREYVESAEAIALPRREILFREILPNVTTPLMVEYGLRLTWSIALVAAVSFLGFGIQQPNADWGLMINENRTGLTIQPWAVVVPAACIALFAIGTNFVTEGISRAVARVGE